MAFKYVSHIKVGENAPSYFTLSDNIRKVLINGKYSIDLIFAGRPW